MIQDYYQQSSIIYILYMHQPKHDNETKYQQQTESSVFSSECYEYKLSSTDKHKLDHLSDHLYKTILGLRNKKIQLLQKQSQVMTQKLQIEEKIKDLQEIKRKRRIDESTRNQKIMLQAYKKRQMMQDKLKEVEIEYKYKHSQDDRQIDLSQAYQLKNLEKKTVQLEEELTKIEQSRKQQLSKHSLSPKQQLIDEIENLQTKKKSILNKKVQARRNQLYKELKQLRCYEIKQLLLRNNIKQRGNQIFDLLSKCKWKQYKTIQIQQYVLSERKQKHSLFEEISKMNEDLKKMQEQNSSLQDLIQNKSINR